eukprot:XP_014016242.1 PREDICTED: uncharacterized protein LOC106580101 isoform X2 [Salmo salar]
MALPTLSAHNGRVEFVLWKARWCGRGNRRHVGGNTGSCTKDNRTLRQTADSCQTCCSRSRGTRGWRACGLRGRWRMPPGRSMSSRNSSSWRGGGRLFAVLYREKSQRVWEKLEAESERRARERLMQEVAQWEEQRQVKERDALRLQEEERRMETRRMAQQGFQNKDA